MTAKKTWKQIRKKIRVYPDTEMFRREEEVRVLLEGYRNNEPWAIAELERRSPGFREINQD